MEFIYKKKRSKTKLHDHRNRVIGTTKNRETIAEKMEHSRIEPVKIVRDSKILGKSKAKSFYLWKTIWKEQEEIDENDDLSLSRSLSDESQRYFVVCGLVWFVVNWWHRCSVTVSFRFSLLRLFCPFVLELVVVVGLLFSFGYVLFSPRWSTCGVSGAYLVFQFSHVGN